MRAILLDWMVDVNMELGMKVATLALAARLSDQYMSKSRNYGKKTLQLVGCTAIWIAAKFEEEYPPALGDFLYMCDGIYARQDMLAMERDMLNQLHFSINLPTVWTINEWLLHHLRFDRVLSRLVQYLSEISLSVYELALEKPSLVAATILCLACFKHGRSYNDVLALTGYTPTDIYGVYDKVYASVDPLLAHIPDGNTVTGIDGGSLFSNIRNKYATAEKSRVSMIDLAGAVYDDRLAHTVADDDDGGADGRSDVGSVDDDKIQDEDKKAALGKGKKTEEETVEGEEEEKGVGRMEGLDLECSPSTRPRRIGGKGRETRKGRTGGKGRASRKRRAQKKRDSSQAGFVRDLLNLA